MQSMAETLRQKISTRIDVRACEVILRIAAARRTTPAQVCRVLLEDAAMEFADIGSRVRSTAPASETKSKLAAPICETLEKRARFERTLATIRDIIGDLEEISSKRIVDELAQVEDGPWAEWGKGRHKKPLTQIALASCAAVRYRDTQNGDDRRDKGTVHQQLEFGDWQNRVTRACGSMLTTQ
jgi:hypothetical protein